MKKSNKLTVAHRFGYAMGDFGGTMTFSIVGSFLTRYYVNVALIDTAVIAAMTLIWKTLDAISNPVMGVIMDKAFLKSKNPRGKFRPWMLRATPLLAITAILLFTAPSMVNGASRLVVVFVTYLMYEAAYTMFNIPYGSLLSAMSGNSEERAKLSSARGLGARVAGTLPQIFFPIIITRFSAEPALGYATGVTLCAAIGFVCCLMCCVFTEERYLPTNNNANNSIHIKDILEVFKNNKAFLAICIYTICTTALQSITATIGTYMYSDVFGNLEIMSIGSIVSLVLSVIFMIFSSTLSIKMGVERLIRHSLLWSAALYLVLFAVCAILSVNVWVYIIVSSLAMAALSLSGTMQWGLVGESIDYNEYLTGKRTEGSIYGTFNMIRRLGQAIGGSFGVAILGAVGYDAVAADAGLAQSDATLLGIKALCLFLPAIFSVGAWAAFKFVWNITPELRSKISKEKIRS
ncbi:MAG: glycoside-pentoside-hexuronide (GPH):cation symporter [Firmicutes bacterium]|nr:glycoside-pentoside-hexuronide (GPH):cation symporter [Bacillota bacterium]